MKSSISKDLDELSDSRSSVRRAAAKRLRKRGDRVAGTHLLAALQKEVSDSRTWETQYQLIMAIGYCGYREAVPFLETLIQSRFGGMRDEAIGDAMVRLSRANDSDATVAIRFIEMNDRSPLVCGALQAVAMLRMEPDASVIRRLVEYGLSLELGDNDWAVIWLLRAAPGWPADIVAPLLSKWESVPFLKQQQIHGAVELARQRKYEKWSVL